MLKLEFNASASWQLPLTEASHEPPFLRLQELFETFGRNGLFQRQYGLPLDGDIADQLNTVSMVLKAAAAETESGLDDEQPSARGAAHLAATPNSGRAQDRAQS